MLASIWFEAWAAEHWISSGNADQIFEAGFRLARVISVAKARAAFLRKVEIGNAEVNRRQTAAHARASVSFRQTHGAEAQGLADRFHKDNPRLTWGQIREKVAKHYGVSAETVKKSLRNPKAKKEVG